MTKPVMLAVWCLLAAAAAARAQQPPTAPPDLDHFKCYFAKGSLQTRLFQLVDQFDVARNQVQRVDDLRIVRFCNPVEKIIQRGPGKPEVTHIRRPDAHLTLFQTDPQPAVLRSVLIRNQFGRQQLSVRDAVVLAVPTGKAELIPGQPPPETPPIPEGLDHFKCYLAGGKAINRAATLRDQFHTEFVRVLQPMAFCNPVEKLVPNPQDPQGPGFFTPITNPNAHLACYTITPVQFQTTVLINNQFGFGTLNVQQADILCVPSLKLHWHEIEPPGGNPEATGNQ